MVCDPCSHTGSARNMVECSVVTGLKFLIMSEHGVPRFHSALGPTTYIANIVRSLLPGIQWELNKYWLLYY